MNIQDMKSQVRLSPPKFWAATKHMPPAEVEELMESILDLARRGDVYSLTKFDFIQVSENN